MGVLSGQTVAKLFTTRAIGGGKVNADSSPTGTLYVNGAADATTVTVTNLAAGLYEAALTLPALSVGDDVELVVAATVGGVDDQASVYHDRCDETQLLQFNADGHVLADVRKVLDVAVDPDPEPVEANLVLCNGSAVGVGAVPNAAAGAVGGLAVVNAVGAVPADLTRVNGDDIPVLQLTTMLQAYTDNVFDGGLLAAIPTAAGIRAAVGLAAANLDTQLDALPTAGEVAAAVGALLPANFAATVISAAGVVNADVRRVNNVLLQGVGVDGNSWRPA